jgi:hypothetical protein
MQLLSDKEALVNMVAESHQAQLNFIEAKEDDINKNATKTTDVIITRVKDAEHQRNSDRVAEIYLLKTFNLNFSN